MQKMYYLSSCTTCKRIMGELQLPETFEKKEIKTEPISADELASLKHLSGSYESLFSRNAKLYRERNYKNTALTETDFKDLILEHYTFLKRPIIINNNEIFIGNSAKTVEAVRKSLQSM